MKAIQSIILGEPDKDKPTAVPPVAKEEVKPVAQPSSSVMPEPTKEKVVQPSGAIMPDPVTSAADDAGPDEYPSRDALPQNESQGQSSGEQITQQSNGMQPPKQYNNMGDAVDAMYKSRMPTEEELKKERKRERAKQIITAIADGTSAIANLYFTGKGAKNVEQTSMSAANAKRYQDILDKRMKMQEKWDDARLSAYDRDRGYNYQKDRDDANWKRSGEWHDSQVKTDNERYTDTQTRNKVLDDFNKTDRDRNYELSKKSQETQEKAQKDASARGWASVNAQNTRAKVQEDKQKAYIKYQFEKANGSPEPKRISSDRSIYVGKSTWEQNAGQIAGEIIKDIEGSNPSLAKQLTRQLNGLAGKKGADAKHTAAIVDKYIMSSPRAQQLAIELEKDYQKRYKFATDGAFPQTGGDPHAKDETSKDPYAKYEEK